MEKVKINSLELENVKRVRVVQLEPTQNGLTIIGGKNGQGKTSVLDGIAWALGGNKYKPTAANREDSVIPAKLNIVLSNGLVVKREGTSGALKVIDPEGKKSGQKLLDSFIGELALNLPKFMNMNNAEKAKELLSLLGVEDELTKIEGEIQSKYSERTEIGRQQTSKQKHAEELPSYPNAPTEPLSASGIIAKQQEVLAQNAKNEHIRNHYAEVESKLQFVNSKIQEREEELKKLREESRQLAMDLEQSQADVDACHDQDTSELERQLVELETINEQVRANKAKGDALIEAGELAGKYKELTEELNTLRQSKVDLLNKVEMPINGLSINEGNLTYNEKEWDCMSGAEQLKVATAIVKALNPTCGFVLMDKLEQMDLDTMKEFGEWLEEEGLQVIATRVTTNANECTVIIEDGEVAGATARPTPVIKKTTTDFGGF